jgi:hypothetical protein
MMMMAVLRCLCLYGACGCASCDAVPNTWTKRDKHKQRKEWGSHHGTHTASQRLAEKRRWMAWSSSSVDLERYALIILPIVVVRSAQDGREGIGGTEMVEMVWSAPPPAADAERAQHHPKRQGRTH